MASYRFRYQFGLKSVVLTLITGILEIAYFDMDNRASVLSSEMNTPIYVVCAAVITVSCWFVVLMYLVSLFSKKYIEVTEEDIRIPKSYFSQKMRVYRFDEIQTIHIGSIGHIPMVTFIFDDCKKALLGSMFRSRREYEQFIDLLRERVNS